MSEKKITSSWLSSASIDDLLEAEIELERDVKLVMDQIDKAKSDPKDISLSWYFRAIESVRSKNRKIGAIKKKIGFLENQQRHNFKLEQKENSFRMKQEEIESSHRRKMEIADRHDRVIIQHIVSELGRDEFMRLISPISGKLESIKSGNESQRGAGGFGSTGV